LTHLPVFNDKLCHALRTAGRFISSTKWQRFPNLVSLHEHTNHAYLLT